MNNTNRPARKSLRYKGYDYSSAGPYFVTICTHRRQMRFGRVVDGDMILSEAGQTVANALQQLESRFPTVSLDEFIIMPNRAKP